VIAPGNGVRWFASRFLDRRIATPATGSRSESGPVAASEKEHPLHASYLTAPARLPKTPGGYFVARTIRTGMSVFSSV
jgi:hypothetical protein